MNVTVKSELDRSFMEQKSVQIVKNGTLKKYFVPYDFYGKFYTEEKVSRTIEIPVRGNLPVLCVKITPKANSVVATYRNGQRSIHCSKLDYTYAGLAESVHPYRISQEDFNALQKPFWFQRGAADWSFCIPMKPVKIDDYYQIPLVFAELGGGRFPAPDETRQEEQYWQGVWIGCSRFVCAIVPFTFDVVTSPIQLIVFTLI